MDVGGATALIATQNVAVKHVLVLPPPAKMAVQKMLIVLKKSNRMRTICQHLPEIIAHTSKKLASHIFNGSTMTQAVTKNRNTKSKLQPIQVLAT